MPVPNVDPPTTADASSGTSRPAPHHFTAPPDHHYLHAEVDPKAAPEVKPAAAEASVKARPRPSPSDSSPGVHEAGELEKDKEPTPAPSVPPCAQPRGAWDSSTQLACDTQAAEENSTPPRAFRPPPKKRSQGQA